MFDMQCIMFVRMRSDIDAEWLCIVLGAYNLSCTLI